MWTSWPEKTDGLKEEWKNPSVSNWNGCLWTEEVGLDITYHTPTMQLWVPSTDILTTIHTWAQLALATHMKADRIDNPQVALTTL